MRKAISIAYRVEVNENKVKSALRVFSKYGSMATKNSKTIFRKIVFGLLVSMWDVRSW